MGSVSIPETLIASMWNGDCIRLEASVALRVAMLREEYRHFISDPALLGTQLDCLIAYYGRDHIGVWKRLAAAGEWDALVRELLEGHYDPAYTRSTLKHYPRLAHAPAFSVEAATDAGYEDLAARCLKRS